MESTPPSYLICEGQRQTNTEQFDAPTWIGERANATDDESWPDSVSSISSRTQRLINAACKAFFIRRGMGPNGNWRNCRFWSVSTRLVQVGAEIHRVKLCLTTAATERAAHTGIETVS